MSVIEINVDITLKLGISQVKLRHGFESHYFFFHDEIMARCFQYEHFIQFILHGKKVYNKIIEITEIMSHENYYK